MTKTPSLVSILMPAYNGAKYLRQAIESVLSQAYPAWELLVVDDGSTDDTAQIVADFSDPRIRYVYQENRGQAAALNHGLELARGDYLTTLDVDDWYTPESLAGRVAFLDQHPHYGAVYGDGIYCDIDGNPLKRFSELRSGDVSGDVFDVMLSNSFFGTGANVMVRKSVIDEHRLHYDESIVWCQDYDFYLRLAACSPFGYVDIPTVWYRLHSTNMTMTMPAGRRKESLIRVKQKILVAPRFETTAPSHKFAFFYQLLLSDVEGLADQLALVRHPQFVGMPKQYQAMILRHLASKYMLEKAYPEEVRQLLWQSFRLHPISVKTTLLLLLSHLNGGPAEWALSTWRRNKLQRSVVSSPFDQINK